MDIYGLLKTLHVVGVILFLGNIIVTGWWKVMADRTGDPAIIAFAQRQVTLTDWVFTAGGVALLGVSGLANALLHGMPLSLPWIGWGIGLFTLSGLIWGAILIPLQVRLAHMARGFAGGKAIEPEYWLLQRRWLVWGIVATVIPLAVVPIMVMKPA